MPLSNNQQVGRRMFSDVYKNRRVFITGHTGFKGSWLAFWLRQMGAVVGGYSLPAPTTPSHFALLSTEMKSISGDIRDLAALQSALAEFAPEMVFHLAAQALVRRSYVDPLETFSSNVLGTVNVFEASRRCASVRAVVNVTSDKCYENREWVWGYRECDPLGGHDPYSASKGCAELVAGAYRRSFFAAGQGCRLASCRAGNVIGGGDWAEDRLVPDLMRAAADKRPARLRNPGATRPWQHVLEPLSGYLLVGQKLFEGEIDDDDAWNFGPDEEASLTVGAIAGRLARNWPAIRYHADPEINPPHEAGLLKLDCSKARARLAWKPVWNSGEALDHTAAWYRDYYRTGTLNTAKDWQAYIDAAQKQGCPWATGRQTLA